MAALAQSGNPLSEKIMLQQIDEIMMRFNRIMISSQDGPSGRGGRECGGCDHFGLNRDRGLICCLSMIFSKNRFP
jgi:hypothetical protein